MATSLVQVRVDEDLKTQATAIYDKLGMDLSSAVRNCVMVAKDPVLVDAYAASLLGYRPSDIDYIMVAEKLGSGCSDLSKLHIVTLEGENTEDLPDKHKILDVNYAVEEVESCSACYGMLISALSQLSLLHHRQIIQQ